MNNLKLEPQSIKSSPYQVRETSGTAELDASLMDLAANMREHGLINPITVRKLPDGEYECVAGHRRLAAARLNGWVNISAMVSDAMSDIAAEDLLVSENLYRQDLTAIEESSTVVRLLKKREVADIAKLCHKSDRWVYRRMAIDKLSTTAKIVARLYKWPAAFCEAMATHNHNQQDALIHAAANGINITFPDVLGGNVPVAESSFFSGSLSALSEVETASSVPRPDKKPRKTAKEATKAPSTATTKAEPRQTQQEAPEMPTVSGEEPEPCPEVKRVLAMLETIENPLVKLDKEKLVLLLVSPDWKEPFSCDYDGALEILWTRMQASIVRKFGQDENFGYAVEEILTGIIGQDHEANAEGNDEQHQTEV